jgi:sensor histidine kinase regulating citrate/malate metabolism
VRDDGPGIAPDVMQGLFKPGASTKGGAHAGSGLSIVRRLIEDIGGQISCRSNSKGTAMDILIPLSE